MTCGGEIRHLGCYSKNEKKPAALLDYSSCQSPLISETHIGNNKTARNLKKITGQSEPSLFCVD